MKKRLLALLLVVVMILSCACSKKETTGTQSGSDTTATTKTDDTKQNETKTDDAATADVTAEPSAETFGGAVKYDPLAPVNNGEEISLDFWLWTSDELYQSIIDRYEAIHPNVKINIVNNPYEDYWVKLPLALAGSDGPALFNTHISYYDNYINYCAPLDIAVEDLQADFNGIDSHLVDGKVAYTDIGYMTGSIFYNKDMWDAAGLTDDDIPETWDEFWEVAKKLTIYEDGQLVQAGWACNNYINSNYLMGLNYQLGQNLFEDDMVTADINNEASQKIMQMILDAYNVHGVGEIDFTDEALVSFAIGQTAMISSWGWLNDYMNANFPDINFGVFEIPVFDKENLYAYNRINTEQMFAINGNADPAQQAVAQDFVRFALANDEVQLDLALALSVLPAKKCLTEDPAITGNKALACVKDHINQYVFPGALPSCFETYLAEAGENILYNGMEISEALQLAEDKINADLAGTGFKSIEDQYTGNK